MTTNSNTLNTTSNTTATTCRWSDLECFSALAALAGQLLAGDLNSLVRARLVSWLSQPRASWGSFRDQAYQRQQSRGDGQRYGYVTEGGDIFVLPHPTDVDAVERWVDMAIARPANGQYSLYKALRVQSRYWAV
jgi:hypothetical protein